MRQPLLKEGLEHHRAGRFDEAERLYRQILATHPNDADALHLLGLIATSRHRYEMAGPLIARAIAAKPDRADFHASLGNLYYARGQTDEMVACYRRALLMSYFHAIPAPFADIAARAGSEPSAADFSTEHRQIQIAISAGRRARPLAVSRHDRRHIHRHRRP